MLNSSDKKILSLQLDVDHTTCTIETQGDLKSILDSLEELTFLLIDTIDAIDGDPDHEDAVDVDIEPDDGNEPCYRGYRKFPSIIIDQTSPIKTKLRLR